MATINRTPPEAPKWRIEIDEEEREYLLAALDFARAYLTPCPKNGPVSAAWPLPPQHYQYELDHIEQVIASVDPSELRNA